jgi:putative membrane protein
MNFIVKILLSSLSVIVASYLLPGVVVENYFAALLVAFVLALLNITLKPILVIFTIPITIFTFGLFLLVINAVMALIADWIIDGFMIDGFLWAMAFSLIVTIINYLINLDGKKRRNYR